MSRPPDCKLKKISALLATGNMANADEIVRLLKPELREEPRTHLSNVVVTALCELLSVRHQQGSATTHRGGGGKG